MSRAGLVTRSSSSQPEASPTNQSIGVRFLGHATTLVDIDGVRVLTDPFLRRTLGPLTRHGPIPDPADLQVDVVVISHGHADHFDRRSLAALPGRPTIVVPTGLGATVTNDPSIAGQVREIAAGESLDLGRLTIRAVPARHWIAPRAPKATPIGYLLDAGARVYFAGDTGRYPGMRALAGTVDVALLPIWTWGPHLGPGHLGPRTAAAALRDIEPRTVIPIHWGTLYPRHLHRVWHRPLVEPAERFETHAGRVAPEVDVRVLQPGEATSIRPRR